MEAKNLRNNRKINTFLFLFLRFTNKQKNRQLIAR